MSDVEDAFSHKAMAAIDPAFAAAFDYVEAKDDPEENSEGGEPTGDAAGGDAASTAEAEGAGAAGESAATPATGAPASPPAAGALPVDPAAKGAGEPGAGTQAAGSVGGPAAVVQGGIDGVAFAPTFAAASEKLVERMDNAFLAQAADEVRAKIAPAYYEHLKKHPLTLVGAKVPNVVAGKPDMTIRDTQEARDWQEATQQLIDDEVAMLANQKSDAIKPLRSAIQESVLMLSNNPDIIRGTKQFDEELWREFTKLAATYELRVNGELYGYQVDVQPLITKLRTDLAARRAVNGERQQVRTAAQQANAANQPRNQQGQFEPPQGGIESKSTLGGETEEDDYDVFWKASGVNPTAGGIRI